MGYGIERFDKKIQYERLLQVANQVSSDQGMEISLSKRVDINFIQNGKILFSIDNFPENGEIDTFSYSDALSDINSQKIKGRVFGILHKEFGTRYPEFGGEESN